MAYLLRHGCIKTATARFCYIVLALSPLLCMA